MFGCQGQGYLVFCREKRVIWFFLWFPLEILPYCFETILAFCPVKWELNAGSSKYPCQVGKGIGIYQWDGVSFGDPGTG